MEDEQTQLDFKRETLTPHNRRAVNVPYPVVSQETTFIVSCALGYSSRRKWKQMNAEEKHNKMEREVDSTHDRGLDCVSIVLVYVY